MLTVGNKVFVPNYGAGIIKNIEFRKVYDTIYKFVDVILMIDNICLSIPINRIEAYRIREIITKDKLEECLKIINQQPYNIENKWNKRYRENNEKIYTGKFDIECEVLRDLYYLKRKGIMPLGEQKILTKVESLVSSEIMLVLDISFNEAFKIISDLGRK
ncbi:transcriptional regulator [Clostridium sp. SYSU_GA19001]|uniref:CarD family transcriptional regulator n=1 Tax=Clostridium caldaquaticum TaxID=2940653 RepID=UPI0020772062|nr:CarD family transcriptional regulator [Clostridium caldaquaticum]MCM8711751.1 transcriptional regulator [Clostridium caldaquaticum]